MIGQGHCGKGSEEDGPGRDSSAAKRRSILRTKEEQMLERSMHQLGMIRCTECSRTWSLEALAHQ